MESNRRPRRWTHGIIAAALTGGLVTLSMVPFAAPAHAEEEPLSEVEKLLEVATEMLQPAPAKEAPAKEERTAAVPAPAEDDDSPGYETPDPVEPDHASAEGLSAVIADNDVASVGSSDAEIRDDHSSSADATILALGGEEVLGAHADSDGTTQESAGDPLMPICEGSDGALCASVLYADASAEEGSTTSRSEARSGVAAACVGGDDPTGETCSGPVGTGVLTSEGEISRDGSGHTEGSSSSAVADVCVAPDPLLGTCTVGAEAVGSEGASDSRGTATKDSYVLGLELGGQGGDFTDPTAIAIPPDCTSPSVACVFLNQGETYIGDGVAGHSVLALFVSALDETIVAQAAQSETLVHQAAPRTQSNPGGPGGPGDGGPGDGGPGDGGPGDGGPGDGGPGDGSGDDVLPETGGFWSGLLAIGLLAIAAGGLLIAFARRQDVDAPAASA